MAHKYDYRHAYRVRRRHWPVHPAVPDEITIEPESPAGEDPPAAEDLTDAPPASDNELFSDREQPVRPSPAQVLVSVVIAARNEARNLRYVFSRLPAGLHQVIIVDGHSVDDTPQEALRLRPDVQIVHQTGKGRETR